MQSSSSAATTGAPAPGSPDRTRFPLGLPSSEGPCPIHFLEAKAHWFYISYLRQPRHGFFFQRAVGEAPLIRPRKLFLTHTLGLSFPVKWRATGSATDISPAAVRRFLTFAGSLASMGCPGETLTIF